MHGAFAAFEEHPSGVVTKTIWRFSSGGLVVAFPMASIESFPVPLDGQVIQPLMEKIAQVVGRLRTVLSEECHHFIDGLLQRSRSPGGKIGAAHFLEVPPLSYRIKEVIRY